MRKYFPEFRDLCAEKPHPGLDLLGVTVSLLGIFLAAAYFILFYCFPGTVLPVP